MSVKVTTYGGWLARKYVPKFASNAYLKLQYIKRLKISKAYIEEFMKGEIKPKPINFLIETVNRCNSTCEFCAASKNYEKRPFSKMGDELFESIVNQIAEWDYSGYISLFVNNEPFMDTRIVEQHKYLREKIPNAKIKVFTNGLLLDKGKFNEIAPYVDLLIINNYCEDMKLHKNIEELYGYLKENPDLHKNLDIQIKIRYIKEVLTNRAGTSPNKQETQKVIKEPCLFPYTDMVIYPNGVVGICCCDVSETTNLGNLKTETLQNIWNGKKYEAVRKNLQDGRNGYPFCKHCDFMDTGLRVKICEEQISN